MTLNMKTKTHLLPVQTRTYAGPGIPGASDVP
jgi:hypothetical protein